jgi:hypothetical protein
VSCCAWQGLAWGEPAHGAVPCTPSSAAKGELHTFTCTGMAADQVLARRRCPLRLCKICGTGTAEALLQRCCHSQNLA